MRPPVLVSLGCHIPGYALPHCDPHCPKTTKAGVQKRFVAKQKTPDPALLKEFQQFVRNWVKTNLTPLAPDVDCSVDEWLSKTHYSEGRKKELRECYAKMTNIWDPHMKYFWLKCFMKDECYPEFKHARGINSRSDEFKCTVGPIFKLIEEVVYKNPHFIKHVPVADRPEYIMNMLYKEGCWYLASDYKSFEAQFSKEIMEACEFELYDWMTQYLPCYKEFMSLCRRVLGGKNRCKYKNFTVEVDATRMSGEMCTSLGNGFSNLMFMLFICEKKGCTDVAIVVEGDDGAATGKGDPPTSEDFAKLGLTIVIDMHQSISTMSFCGIIFDEVDRKNVTNPCEVLAGFGWCGNRYKGAKQSKLNVLLRAKALSYAHQYPGCPVIGSLAQYGLRCTRGTSINHYAKKSNAVGYWEREQLLAAMKDEKKISFIAPSMRTRLLVEEKFGITVSHQIEIEEYLDSLDTVQPLKIPGFDSIAHPSWAEYFDEYAIPVNHRQQDLDYAGEWAQRYHFALPA